MLRNFAIALAAVLSLACSAPTFDATSNEAMKASIDKVQESLPKEKQADFSRALGYLMFVGTDSGPLSRNKLGTGTGALGEQLKSLQGKTGEEIIAEAERLRKERDAQRLAGATAEIAALEQRAAAAEAVKPQMAAFQVRRAKLSLDPGENSIGPEIELSVHNGMTFPVYSVTFRGTLTTPGRNWPLVQEEFTYPAPEGLQPGESATWTARPGLNSDFTRKAPADSTFRVEVTQLYDANGKIVLDALGLDEMERMRLEDLRQRAAERR